MKLFKWEDFCSDLFIGLDQPQIKANFIIKYETISSFLVKTFPLLQCMGSNIIIITAL